MNDPDPQTESAILDRLGPPPRDATPAQITLSQREYALLPAALHHIWRVYGFITLAEGRLHLVDPARFAPLMSYIFEGDPDLDGNVQAIAYGSLGELVLWSGRHGYGFLSPALSTLEMPNLTGDSIAPPEAQFVDQVLHMPPELIDAYDPAREPVHDRLVAKLGPLPYGAIYGTTPVPPPLEGTPVEHYVVAEVRDWLEAVYAEIAVSLVDWARTPSQLRQIGEPWPAGLKGKSGK